MVGNVRSHSRVFAAMVKCGRGVVEVGGKRGTLKSVVESEKRNWDSKNVDRELLNSYIIYVIGIYKYSTYKVSKLVNIISYSNIIQILNLSSQKQAPHFDWWIIKPLEFFYHHVSVSFCSI